MIYLVCSINVAQLEVYLSSDGDEIATCFALIILLMPCGCKCYVALPHDAVGWSAVCDCGIFR